MAWGGKKQSMIYSFSMQWICLGSFISGFWRYLSSPEINSAHRRSWSISASVDLFS